MTTAAETVVERSDDTYRLGRRPALDGVRAIAIALVLWNHTALPNSGTAGTMGVVLFFVLSGFLITRLLLEEWQTRGSIRLRGFYLRRALRLFPAMAAYLVVTTFIALRYSEPLDQILWSALYVMNLARTAGEYVTLAPHTWSLAMEEQFYLVWPLLLVLMLVWKRVPLRAVTWLVIAVVAASLAYRWALVSSDASLQRLHNDPFAVAGCLLAGCLLALRIGLLKGSRLFGGAAVLLSLGVILACSVHEKSPLIYGLAVPLATVASYVLLGALARDGHLAWWIRSFFESRPLRYLGRISYGLYLWHYSVYYVVKHEMAGHHLATTLAKPLLQVTLSFVVAVLSYHLLEQRFLKMKERTR